MVYFVRIVVARKVDKDDILACAWINGDSDALLVGLYQWERRLFAQSVMLYNASDDDSHEYRYHADLIMFLEEGC